MQETLFHSKIKGDEKWSEAWYEKVGRSTFVYGNKPGGDKVKVDEWYKKQAKYLNWLSKLTKKGFLLPFPTMILKNGYRYFPRVTEAIHPKEVIFTI